MLVGGWWLLKDGTLMGGVWCRAPYCLSRLLPFHLQAVGNDPSTYCWGMLNVWGYVQAKVDGLGCKSFEESKEAVHEQFAALPLPMLQHLYKSMPNRIASVVENRGDKTKY